jgi:hypothetical protein
MPMGQSEMPDFEFTSPERKRFTVTGATPEQAWAVLQQHLTGAGSRRDAGPADWGAVPAEPEGPAKWGAIPLEHHDKSAPGLVSGTGRAFSRGAPVAGGLLNKADAATDAALLYALNRRKGPAQGLIW